MMGQPLGGSTGALVTGNLNVMSEMPPELSLFVVGCCSRTLLMDPWLWNIGAGPIGMTDPLGMSVSVEIFSRTVARYAVFSVV